MGADETLQDGMRSVDGVCAQPRRMRLVEVDGDHDPQGQLGTGKDGTLHWAGRALLSRSHHLTSDACSLLRTSLVPPSGLVIPLISTELLVLFEGTHHGFPHRLLVASPKCTDLDLLGFSVQAQVSSLIRDVWRHVNSYAPLA